jgi:hypothetical protein
MHSETATRPTPENIFNTLIAFHRSAALRTAIELDIFTAIGDGENEPASLAKKSRCGGTRHAHLVRCFDRARISNKTRRAVRSHSGISDFPQ